MTSTIAKLKEAYAHLAKFRKQHAKLSARMQLLSNDIDKMYDVMNDLEITILRIKADVDDETDSL